ncbi:MAG: hypothetical protein ACFFCF_07635 [Promethearchaeota archaeon]
MPMDIHIKGAREHNLKNIDVQLGDGLTVVTGVSGSGKTSLVFDTLYHEANRRFLEIFLYGRGGQRLAPANVETITGLGPTIAVGQNLLNRNPRSTLATASGLHPFFRLLFANYGVRYCLQCNEPLSRFTDDDLVERLASLAKQAPHQLFAPLLRKVKGSHQTLLSTLSQEFDNSQIIVDGKEWEGATLSPSEPHSIELRIGLIDSSSSTNQIRKLAQQATALGAGALCTQNPESSTTLATTQICSVCGAGFRELRPTHFNQPCPYCKGKGCTRCDNTGMHPQAASVRWEGFRLPELLELSVEESSALFKQVTLPSTAKRLHSEIQRRLDALKRVGLGYLLLNRASPTLSRGESQRVRLSISLASRLEDILHVLDEPTIGQHPADIARLLPAFRELPGPVIFVEHERVAAAAANHAIDLGPGAGKEGGKIVFTGSPANLWLADTATGQYFSLQRRVMTPKPRPAPAEFIWVKKAYQHNLKHLDAKIPLGRLTVISGVSGSGKSTFVEHVLVPSLSQKKPIGCNAIEGPWIKPILVDQSPIGRNPRSNPATYTKLADIIRDLFAEATGLTKSHFSFNRPEGACSACKGIGATEVKMQYLPSIWIPCEECEGQRFNPEVLSKQVEFDGEQLSIADFYKLPISEVGEKLTSPRHLSSTKRESAQRILDALNDVGLGYLELGQPSPTLSGGEAQRVKLTKFLGRNRLNNQLIVLDEPSTGLHPQDLDGLLIVLDRLVRHGATIVVVEHNTDLIRAADWVIDLGPGAGPRGGMVLYEGPPTNLLENKHSLTGRALKNEEAVQPRKATKIMSPTTSVIAVRNARANNLKGIDVDIPKGTLTVVTGVSGSGKSSLVQDVLQTEARRRYLETLSMFERQGIREGPEAVVDSIKGLGVTLTVATHRAHLWSHIPQFTRRNIVGTLTELSFHLANVLAALGQRTCLKCEAQMQREDQWVCPNCANTAPIAKPQYFSSSHWLSSCKKCNGLGILRLPQPEKLIVNPDKPLCAGAMWSPGYWPKTYLCKDQPIIPELGKGYGFDPFKTPWNKMSKKAQEVFFYGDGKTYKFTYTSKSTGKLKGKQRQTKWTWKGFYQKESWIYNWDVHGTYTKEVICPECQGAGLRPEFLTVTLQNKNIYEMSEMPLAELETLISQIPAPPADIPLVETSIELIRRRLRFLRQVGIGYLHLNRPIGTLSAGEAQRIQLASLLGSGLTSLTILIDEPSRGMHPSELEALLEALHEICNQGNTVIMVEHDLQLIRAADHIIDLGPKAGAFGGKVVAEGTPAELITAKTLTGKWLQTKRGNKPCKQRGLLAWMDSQNRRPPKSWMVVTGARENNLQGEEVRFPLRTFTGVCGVSGSGKSTLLIDTIGRALIKQLHSSSFAREPLEPGEYDTISGNPHRTLMVDQSRRGIKSPASYLNLLSPMYKLFVESDDAEALGLEKKELTKPCSACKGRGVLRIDMGFLPNELIECETCKGSGYRPETWEVRVNGVTLPELNQMTLNEVSELFKDEPRLAEPLEITREVGLGYLVWNQRSYTLSGGEVQRLKIAKELLKKTKKPTLYILDEPSVGLHMEDIAQLITVLQKLVDSGHTVIVVEHHPYILASCDWLIELGPVGGPNGGQIIATGTPEAIATTNTPTAPYLREVLEGNP